MDVSVVVPVYRSSRILPELTARMEEVLSEHFRAYECILVNDASPDDSWGVVRELSDRYAFVTGVDLRKNVGQDNAIMAGLHHATGEVVIVMDDDLQHDPADIPALCAAVRDGADVAFARFERKRQALWKNMGSWLADRVAVRVLGKPPDVYMSPYKALRRDVVEEILRYDGPFTYVDGLIFTVTSRISQVDARHHPRFAGSGNYDLRRSFRVWMKLATSFSVAPLRIVTLLGGVISLFSFGLATFFVIEALVEEQLPPGWPSLIVTVSFLGGIQLLGIGAIGEYVGRVFITQNKRPQFTVRDVYRGGEDESSGADGGDPRQPADASRA